MSKSYKKAVTIGIAAFSAVALLSTGAAAFVLTNEITKDTTGNITVGTVTENSAEITITSTDHSIKFDASNGDTTGRVQWDETNSEKLTATITGTVTATSADTSMSYEAINNAYELSYSFTVSNKTNFDKYVSYDSNTAATEYVKLIGIKVSTEPNDCQNTITLTDGGENTANFTITVEFKWGSAFGGMNPSLFYDDTSATNPSSSIGASIEESEIKTTLGNLQNLNDITYTITIKASPKSSAAA